jgi:hypothetical protein
VGGGCRDSSRSPSKNAAAGSSAETSVEGAVPDDLIAAAEQAIKSAKSAGGHLARLVVIDERSESQAISSRS